MKTNTYMEKKQTIDYSLLATEYSIFIDTCSLMRPQAQDFLMQKIVPYLKLEDKKSEPQTFIEVKKDIKDKLVKITGSSEARQIAEELEFDVDMDGYDGVIENELYAKLKLTVEETGFFTQDDSTIPNVGSKWTYGDLLEKVFDVEGRITQLGLKKSATKL